MKLATLVAALTPFIVSASCVSLGGAPDAVNSLTALPPGPIPMTPLDMDPFKPMGKFLVQRCGTLDCHGSVGRNLRLYGAHGLRLGDGADPTGAITTDDEYEADYESIIGLEPELMSEVFAQGGANPALLTFYRKPTAIEHHKGGQVIFPGDASNPPDDQSNCITSWLAGAIDTTACAAAADTTLYP